MPAPATRAMEARRQREGGLQVAGIRLCGRKARHEWRRAVEALDNPPSPTAAARDAVRNYRARIANAG